MNDTTEFIDAMALAVSDSFTSPEVFGTVCRQISKETGVIESEISNVMIACYSYYLWEDNDEGARKTFLVDYINSVLGGE